MLTSPSEQRQNGEGGGAWSGAPSPAEVAISDVMPTGRSPGTEATGHTGLRRSRLECHCMVPNPGGNET